MSEGSGAGAAVEARGVTRFYGAFAALDGVDLAVAPGETLLLLGHNGAGKSTFLRLAATLQRPSGGTLLLFGRDPQASDGPSLRRRIGLLSHQTFLYDHLTAEENLRFYGRLYGLAPATGDLRRTLREVGLAGRGDDPVRAFSRGMQQRLAIARALLHEPDLLLLDEPFTGLDREGVATLRAMLRAWRRETRSCLMATHDFAAALPLATRVVILAHGRVVLDRDAAGLDPAALERLYRDAGAAPAPA